MSELQTPISHLHEHPWLTVEESIVGFQDRHHVASKPYDGSPQHKEKGLQNVVDDLEARAASARFFLFFRSNILGFVDLFGRFRSDFGRHLLKVMRARKR